MIIMQEFGRHLVIEPFVETVGLAGGLIENAGSPAQREAYLPQIMAGRKIWALAWAEGRSRLRPEQRQYDSAASGRQLCC